MTIEMLNNEIRINSTYLEIDHNVFNLLTQYAGYNEVIEVKYYSDCSVLFMNGLVITINPFSDVKKTIEDIFEELDEEIEIIDERGIWKC